MVPSDFLEALQLSEEDRAKLASFGADSACALLAIRKASKDAFDNYLGRDRVENTVEQLERLLTSEQRHALQQSAKAAAGPLGARLGPTPVT